MPFVVVALMVVGLVIAVASLLAPVAKSGPVGAGADVAPVARVTNMSAERAA